MLIKFFIIYISYIRYFLFLFCSLIFTTANAASLPSVAEVLEIKDDDMILGSKDSKISLIEYSSLSCIHCASFHNKNFHEIKSKLIDTGKIKYVYRDYPTTMSSLTGAMLAHCLSGESSEKYFELLFIMFKTQTTWVFQQNYADSLLSILKLYGIEEDKFKLCLKNQNISSNLTKRSFEAGKMLDISYTPTFFLNGQKMEGEINVNDILEKIKNSSENAKNSK